MCPVTGRIRVGKTETCFGARLMARPSLWDTKSGRLTGKGGHAGEVNAALNKISVSVIVCHKEILARKGSMTAEQVKNAFQSMACSQKTLTVEGYHRQLRKVTRNKGVFTSDTALEKLLYWPTPHPAKVDAAGAKLGADGSTTGHYLRRSIPATLKKGPKQTGSLIFN